MSRSRVDSYVNTLAPPSFCRGVFTAAWLLLTPIAIAYGVTAMQYGLFNFLGPHGPFRNLRGGAPAQNWSRWNDEIMTPVVDRAIMEGPGSTTATQTERYGRSWFFMSPHQ